MTTRSASRPLEPLLEAAFDSLSRRLAGGQRSHPDSLLPGADNPLEGMFPTEMESQVPSFDWFDPTVWAQSQPGDISEDAIASINFPSPGAGMTGQGLDFFRNGEAPSNYTNRHNPLYVARRDFITQVAPKIEDLFGVQAGGVGYLRPPLPSDADPGGRSSNSDHYSGGAVDFYGDEAQLDALRDWLVEQPYISFVRWKSESHDDHLHASFDISWVAQNFFQGQTIPNIQPLPERQASTPGTTPSDITREVANVGRGAPVPEPAAPPPLDPGGGPQ